MILPPLSLPPIRTLIGVELREVSVAIVEERSRLMAELVGRSGWLIGFAECISCLIELTWSIELPALDPALAGIRNKAAAVGALDMFCAIAAHGDQKGVSERKQDKLTRQHSFGASFRFILDSSRRYSVIPPAHVAEC